MTTERKEPDYERIARLLMFDRETFAADFNAGKLGIVFRKGKGVADINKAIKLSLKRGYGRTEKELDWIALYIKDVFKKG